MKQGIHPDYKKTTIKCVCGNEIETGSVVDNITVEICNNATLSIPVSRKFLTLKVALKDLINVTAAKKLKIVIKNLHCSPFLKSGLQFFIRERLYGRK